MFDTSEANPSDWSKSSETHEFNLETIYSKKRTKNKENYRKWDWANGARDPLKIQVLLAI